MRNLTIKRTKSFVGCLAKMKIYIEDHASVELVINDTPCRKIGELKNGEEATFQIGEGAAKVFVIADKVSRNYCNDYYQLPEGEEDVVLTGKNKYNPASGNAFRFDGNDNEEVRASRKRGTRRGLRVLIISGIIGLVIGILIALLPDIIVANTPKTFSAYEMSITLTEEFEEMTYGTYSAVFGSENVAVFALEEEFALAEGFGDYTLEEYAELIIEGNGIEYAELKKDGELTYFEYSFSNPETGVIYRYFCYVYKTDDAFWLIQFATPTDKVDKYAPKIRDWAGSVKFSG
ncbi:MAG: hypothetical protein IKA64_03280 [Clostridia bacterium]|nr:hypothetical protein [Clostridia bacterium]